MSATMARQGGRVQLEQSDMRLDYNEAKMVIGGFSHGAIEETQYLIKKPRTAVREEMKGGVEFPCHKQVKAVIETHPAMLRQNHTAGCLPCQNCMAKDLQTRWRRNVTGAPLPNWRRQPTPELTPPLPGTLPVPAGYISAAQCAQIVTLPAGYAYSHTSLPCAEFFTLNASAQDSQHDTDFDPDILTDKGASTS